MSNIFRVGIDKISLYNFKIKTDRDFKKELECKDNSIKEKTIIDNEFFSIMSSYVLYQTPEGIEESVYNRITFNPNKLLTGDNISNSSSEDLVKALEKLKSILKTNGVELDLSESKIADIEINLNVPVELEEYKEVFLLIFEQFKYADVLSGLTHHKEFLRKREDKGFFSALSKSVTFKVYSKSKEKGLSFPVTRLEYFFEMSAYKYLVEEKYNLDNSLKTLIGYPSLLENIFRHRARNDFAQKVFKYLEKVHKPLLEDEYLAFKAANKLAREKGRKEERDVYGYLEKYWIFDYSFLVELVNEYDSKHKGRETQRIIKKYSKYKNLEKLNFLLEKIFPTNFN